MELILDYGGFNLGIENLLISTTLDNGVPDSMSRSFNLGIENLLISTPNGAVIWRSLSEFQSRNRESSNFYWPIMLSEKVKTPGFNLGIENLLISTQRPGH